MLSGKVAVVTGAARGIGLDIAAALAESGARVVLADLDGEECATAAQRLQERGRVCLAVTANAAMVPDIEAMIAAAVQRFGPPDILVNNAGGSAHTPKQIEEVTEEQFDRVMTWNVRSTFFCVKTVLPHMKGRGGSIINIVSVAGRAGWEGTSPQYSAAKAGVIGMTRNLARHLGPHGIRVNAIAPGFIKSGARAQALWDSRDTTAVMKQIPLRRRGELRDISQVALFLASDASSYMTGTVLDVNGGFMCV